MKDIENSSRREFLKTSAASGAGLVIGFMLPGPLKAAMAAAAASVQPNLDYGSNSLPNAFIKIAPDGIITLIVNKLEMGQGVFTSVAQLVAEELECDWKAIRAESAPVAPVYNHTAMPMQMTGGSTALMSSWEQQRRVGYMAREMLISAAAKKWNVDRVTCTAKNGEITHPAKGKLTYGELAEAAAKEAPPKEFILKDPKDFKVIGQSIQRLDAVDKTTGKAIYGIDVKIPGMQYACVAHPPFGAKLKTFNEAAAKAVNGVTAVIRFDETVAVIGTNTFAAKKGRDALSPEYDMSIAQKISTPALMQSYKELAKTKGTLVVQRGNPDAAFAKAKSFIEVEYEFPYLAHASMEPLNCTVDFDGKSARLWSGHQMPTMDLGAVAKTLEIAPDKIDIKTAYAGGSFGRRASKTSDYIVEACKIAKSLKKPVKLVWTREDDMKGGYYRPMYYHRAKIGFDEKNHLLGWQHTIVGQSIMGGSPLEAMMIKNGIDPTVVEGVSDQPYFKDNFAVDLHMPKHEVTTLWWRSVGHTHTSYVVETLIDEIAAKMKKDPLKLRKELLKDSPRYLAVLDLLEKKSGWGKTKPQKGHAFGIAIHESFNSVVGHVVEVALEGSHVSVKRVISAVHCGTVVNPQGAKTQVEGAIAYGMSACLDGEITIDQGRVVQNNFNDYQVVRLNQMPKIEVHFVQTHDAPTGLGEPGLPPLAPAIANAIFKLNGKRLRKLPFKKELSQA